MKAEAWMGRIVTFYPKPEEAVIVTVIQNDALLVAGEVVGTYKVPPFGPGKIPDLGLLVRGRSKQKLKITVVANYVEKHSSWKEADATIQKP
jgi:hypothetical protein